MKTTLKIALATTILFAIYNIYALACTNFLVTKGASADGSVFVTYNADSYGMYGNMYHHTGKTHNKGDVRKIYEWDTNKYLGEIPEAAITYNVIGQMNEFQVSVTETTFGGREELADSTGIIDYGSLIYIALERSKTAKEAIQVMTSLVEQYGYYSEGESFSICDKNEAWVMEMMGKGPGGKGAVWVAVKIPDGYISAHANQSRITKFLKLFPKENVMYSKDVIKFAREKGYFTGKDVDFSFRDAYAPNDFSAVRYCDARVWSFFNHHVKGMDQYLDYVLCKDLQNEMPLYVLPETKLTLEEVMADMRDHYEGTPLDITKDLGAGAWEMPYRPSPLSKKVDGQEVFNERPISTQQTGFSFVGQMRSWLADAIGGVIWWTNDDANMAPYVPIYCGATNAPKCFVRVEGEQDEVTFSWNSAFWLQNTVANMVYPYYSKIFLDLKRYRDQYETAHIQQVRKLSVAEFADKSATEVCQFVNDANEKSAEEMMTLWNSLFQYIVVKHNDMVVKRVDSKDRFVRTKEGFAASPIRPGYSEDYWKKIQKETGDRYLVK